MGLGWRVDGMYPQVAHSGSKPWTELQSKGN